MSVPLDLVIEAQKGNQIAISKVMKGCEGLVVQYAKIFYSEKLQPLVSFEDMLEQGYVGIWKALRAFKPECGNKFTTYAVYCIKSHMVAELKMFNRKKNIKNIRYFHRAIEEILADSKTIEYEVLEEREYKMNKIVDHVNNMSFKHRNNIERRYLDLFTMSPREIAKEQQCSSNSVIQLTKNALKNIRKSVLPS